MVERFSAPLGSVHRELTRAVDAGIVEKDASVRPHRFQAATASPVFEPLKKLLERTIGVEIELESQLSEVDGVELALIYGSWARGALGPQSDVDLLVAGDFDYPALQTAIRFVEERTARRIDLTAFESKEFRERIERGDGFLVTVLSRPVTPLIGTPPLMKTNG